MNTLGSRIRLVRGAESQEAFASRAGISKGAIGGYERDANSPSADVVLKICSSSNISVEWLMTGRGSMYPGEAQSEHPEQTQPSEIASTTPCARCEKLEEELAEERRERRELSAELREVNAELRRLARENGELLKENAELRKEKTEETLTISELRRRKIEGTLSPLDEQQNIPPSNRHHPHP